MLQREEMTYEIFGEYRHRSDSVRCRLLPRRHLWQQPNGFCGADGINLHGHPDCTCGESDLP